MNDEMLHVAGIQAPDALTVTDEQGQLWTRDDDGRWSARGFRPGTSTVDVTVQLPNGHSYIERCNVYAVAAGE